MNRRNAPNNRVMEAPSFRVGSHQFTGDIPSRMSMPSRHCEKDGLSISRR